MEEKTDYYSHQKEIKNNKDDAMVSFPFSLLPADLKLHIFCFLPVRSFSSVPRVDKEWNRLASSDTFWKRKFVWDNSEELASVLENPGSDFWALWKEEYHQWKLTHTTWKSIYTDYITWDHVRSPTGLAYRTYGTRVVGAAIRKWVTSSFAHASLNRGFVSGVHRMKMKLLQHTSTDGSTFKVGDVITQIVDMEKGNVLFEKNSVFEGISVQGIKAPHYPVVLVPTKSMLLFPFAISRYSKTRTQPRAINSSPALPGSSSPRRGILNTPQKT